MMNARRESNLPQWLILAGALVFNPYAGSFCILGSRHPLAPFLPGLDVRRDNCAQFSPKPMGIFHRPRGCRFVGLHERLREHFSLQRNRASDGMDPHRPSATIGSADRDPSMAVKLFGGRRLSLGTISD